MRSSPYEVVVSAGGREGMERALAIVRARYAGDLFRELEPSSPRSADRTVWIVPSEDEAELRVVEDGGCGPGLDGLLHERLRNELGEVVRWTPRPLEPQECSPATLEIPDRDDVRVLRFAIDDATQLAGFLRLFGATGAMLGEVFPILGEDGQRTIHLVDHAVQVTPREPRALTHRCVVLARLAMEATSAAPPSTAMIDLVSFPMMSPAGAVVDRGRERRVPVDELEAALRAAITGVAHEMQRQISQHSDLREVLREVVGRR